MGTPIVPSEDCAVQEFYDAFAPYYDDFYDLIDYAEWARVIQSHIPSVENNTRKILEIGCGTGSLLTELRKHDDQIIFGLDLSDEMLRRCLAKVGTDAKPPLIQSDALFSCFLPNSFDVVIGNFSLLNHFEQVKRRQLLREVFAVLRTNGVFVTDFATLARYRQLVRQSSETESVKKESQIAEISQTFFQVLATELGKSRNSGDSFWLERSLTTINSCVKKRLYFFNRAEITLDFCTVGFQIVEQSSPVRDSFDHAPNRIMLVARKP